MNYKPRQFRTILIATALVVIFSFIGEVAVDGDKVVKAGCVKKD